MSRNKATPVRAGSSPSRSPAATTVTSRLAVPSATGTKRGNVRRPTSSPGRPRSAARLKRFEPRMTPTPTSLAPENTADEADAISGASAPSAVMRPSSPAASPSFSPSRLSPQTRASLAPRVAARAARNAATAIPVDKDAERPAVRPPLASASRHEGWRSGWGGWPRPPNCLSRGQGQAPTPPGTRHQRSPSARTAGKDEQGRLHGRNDQPLAIEPGSGQHEEAQDSGPAGANADPPRHSIAAHAHGLDPAQISTGLVVRIPLPEVVDCQRLHDLNASRECLNKGSTKPLEKGEHGVPVRRDTHNSSAHTMPPKSSAPPTTYTV